MHMPAPLLKNVQIVLSKTRAALEAENLDRQSASVNVGLVRNCKFVAAVPGCEVCPQPEAVELTPPPTKALPSVIGWTRLVKAIVEAVWTREMSLASVVDEYDGWLTILAVEWAIPPVVR